MESIESYMLQFEDRLANYIPPKESWTPADFALFEPCDLFRIPLNEAEEMRFDAIKHAFSWHYNNNDTYKLFCAEYDVTPLDIKTPEDLDKIILIADHFFKKHPAGKDFAICLGNLITGEIPQVVINNNNPSFDEVIDAFNQAGMVVSYSSGTSGLHTVIPRDLRTYQSSQFAASKSVITMAYPDWDSDLYGYLLMPNPRKSRVFAGKVCGIYFNTIQ